AKAADHWLISPELPGTEQEISFYLRAITKRYGEETFEVLASKTDNKPESFELVEGFSTDAEDWTPFYVMLPEGSKYFAIRHTSNDMFGVMVDDVSFNYVGTVSKYNVYYDKQLVATVENGVTTYTIAADKVDEGEHTFAVTAVYVNGQESKPVSVSIMVASGIQQIMADGQLVDIFTLDGKLVRSQAKSLDGLKGVYVVGGKKVIIR
ncbi:MAG: choice-of-anchor J domain-containing protein, partial [Prevotella sp.]|nr:choice-of-anchor J domain-containing protein [Prevotella sp.]